MPRSRITTAGLHKRAAPNSSATEQGEGENDKRAFAAFGIYHDNPHGWARCVILSQQNLYMGVINIPGPQMALGSFPILFPFSGTYNISVGFSRGSSHVKDLLINPQKRETKLICQYGVVSK